MFMGRLLGEKGDILNNDVNNRNSLLTIVFLWHITAVNPPHLSSLPRLQFSSHDGCYAVNMISKYGTTMCKCTNCFEPYGSYLNIELALVWSEGMFHAYHDFGLVI